VVGGGVVLGKERFLAALRNDSGGRGLVICPIGDEGISRCARNDSGGRMDIICPIGKCLSPYRERERQRRGKECELWRIRKNLKIS